VELSWITPSLVVTNLHPNPVPGLYASNLEGYEEHPIVLPASECVFIIVLFDKDCRGLALTW